MSTEAGDADEWAEAGFTARGRAAWTVAGVDGPINADAWRSNGFTAEQAGAWITAGVAMPTNAYTFRTLGLAPEDLPADIRRPDQWAFTHLAEVPFTREWAALLHSASPGFVRIGHAAGHSLDEISALAAAMSARRPGWGGVHPQYRYRSVAVDCHWDEERTATFEEWALRLRSLDWGDATTCLRAGLSIDETVEHLRQGRDMEPVRTLAALNRRR